MSTNINFICPKCGNTSYETGEIRTTGGFLSKL
ncbi:MAG: zinc ribbon domain-containing protein, partial [Methanosarcina sp.]